MKATKTESNLIMREKNWLSLLYTSKFMKGNRHIEILVYIHIVFDYNLQLIIHVSSLKYE